MQVIAKAHDVSSTPQRLARQLAVVLLIVPMLGACTGGPQSASGGTEKRGTENRSEPASESPAASEATASSNNASETIGDTTAGAEKGPCRTEGRLPFESTVCDPTMKQVAAAAGIVIPPDAQDFTASYEQALDWHLASSFTVTQQQAMQYFTVPTYSATSVGGPQSTGRGPQGEFRSLRLTPVGKANDRVKVEFEAFTS